MFDLIVIGGGPGGYAAAVHAAKNGMSVALVEKDRLGGTCLQRGCVPTKAYLHATEAAQHALPFAPDAVTNFDRRAMLAQKNAVVTQLTEGLKTLMKTHKITVFEGVGTLERAPSVAPPLFMLEKGSKENALFSVTVKSIGGSESLTASRVLLATGSRPARIPVTGCDDPAVWTSDDLLGDAGAEPFSSLVIVGGGVIGVEMAFVFARLGVQVTIVEAEKNCLPMMDKELSRAAETLLKGINVSLWMGAKLAAIEKKDGNFIVCVDKSGESLRIPSERVLLATGRRPVTDGLWGEGISLSTERGFLCVDEHFETSLRGVYAIGDVNGRMQLAHAAHAQGLSAVSHMLGKPAPVNTHLVPSCVYTTPEIASVGLSQDEAKARGIEVIASKALTTQNARTLIDGLGRGFIKLIFAKDSKVLLGAQLFCGRATDLLGELTLAIEQGLTAEALLLPMRAHPTFYEAVTDAIEVALKG